jgi:lipid-binding SYLF domain-containing protein
MTKTLLIATLTTMGMLGQKVAPDKRLENAQMAFQEVMASPDKGIPQELLEKARCAIIVPGLIKGAFLLGGKYGRGFVSCRTAEGWSSPAAVRIKGGSFGLQLGGSSTDIIMLVMNESGMDRLLSDKFTIGGEAAAAAGQASATADALLHAQILSWSRSQGVFAGLSLEGATLRPDGDENRKLYGREVTNREILEAGVTTPRAARSFIAMLNKYSGSRTGTAFREETKPLTKTAAALP